MTDLRLLLIEITRYGELPLGMLKPVVRSCFA